MCIFIFFSISYANYLKFVTYLKFRERKSDYRVHVFNVSNVPIMLLNTNNFIGFSYCSTYNTVNQAANRSHNIHKE